MPRFSLRLFFVLLTVAFLTVPPLLYRLTVNEDETAAWREYNSSTEKRDLALVQWRAAKRSFEESDGNLQAVADAAAAYHHEASVVCTQFKKIVEIYDLEMQSDGTVAGYDSRFQRAKRRYGKRP